MEDARALPRANAFTASPFYFQALGIPVLDGRDFSETDRANSPAVLIVNRSMARHYWPSETALGRQISTDTGKTWSTIVGVVADSRNTLDAEVEDTLYVPVDQVAVARTILIRTTGNRDYRTVGSPGETQQNSERDQNHSLTQREPDPANGSGDIDWCCGSSSRRGCRRLFDPGVSRTSIDPTTALRID